MEISAAVVSQVQRDVAPAKAQEVDKKSEEKRELKADSEKQELAKREELLAQQTGGSFSTTA